MKLRGGRRIEIQPRAREKEEGRWMRGRVTAGDDQLLVWIRVSQREHVLTIGIQPSGLWRKGSGN